MELPRPADGAVLLREPPAGLATDGASPPASPRSPQRSPVPVTPELNSPALLAGGLPANGPVGVVGLSSPTTIPASEDGAAPDQADLRPHPGIPRTPAPGPRRGLEEDPGCVLLPSGLVTGFP